MSKFTGSDQLCLISFFCSIYFVRDHQIWDQIAYDIRNYTHVEILKNLYRSSGSCLIIAYIKHISSDLDKSMYNIGNVKTRVECRMCLVLLVKVAGWCFCNFTC